MAIENLDAEAAARRQLLRQCRPVLAAAYRAAAAEGLAAPVVVLAEDRDGWGDFLSHWCERRVLLLDPLQPQLRAAAGGQFRIGAAPAAELARLLQSPSNQPLCDSLREPPPRGHFWCFVAAAPSLSITPIGLEDRHA